MPPKAALVPPFTLHEFAVPGVMGTSKSSWSLGSQTGAEVTAAQVALTLSCWGAEPAWGWDGERKRSGA